MLDLPAPKPKVSHRVGFALASFCSGDVSVRIECVGIRVDF